MTLIPLAPGWTEHIVWDSTDPKAKGRFAYYQGRQIVYLPRWWMTPTWSHILPLLQAHERGHSWGIKQCLGGHTWCLMAEESSGVDNIWEKFLMWPSQLGHGLQYCDDCLQFLKDLTR